MSNFIGIDPGASGALVAIDKDLKIVDYLIMPLKMDGQKSIVDASKVADFIEQHKPEFVALERVGARPGQGVVSMFSFGRNFGALEAIINAMQLPLHLISPQRWKAMWDLTGKDKDATRLACLDLFPDMEVLTKKAKGQAIADAYWLGLCAKELHHEHTEKTA